MKGKVWKTTFVIFLVIWAIYEITPPGRKSLIDVFEKNAVVEAEADRAPLDAIIEEARALNAENPDHEYQNLVTAIGDTSIAKYFPQFEIDRVRGEVPSILYELEKLASGKINLGLDLRGGSSFLVKVGEPDDEDLQMSEQKLSKAIEVMRKRVDGFGVAEPIIQPVGDDQISIQLPGLTQAAKEAARTQIQKPAILEFRLVHPESAQKVSENVVPPLHEMMYEYSADPLGEEIAVPYIVERESAGGLGGEHLRSAYVASDMLGSPEIILRFTTEGARIFGDVTGANVGRQLAIVLDGEIQTAPVIQTAIREGEAIISGDYTYEQATSLANVLENPLQTPVEIIQENSVDPSLGKDSIASGIRACLYGSLVVLVFMCVYYAMAGLIASFAMCFNVLILLGAMTSLDATLTLPGIAGIVLTIGMAVDANVLIFERIREELRDGKSLRHSINAGYDKAFSTIIDANITTLIASMILMKLGAGPVQGFGTTLTFGILASILTSIVVTRLFFEALLAGGGLKRFQMLRVIGDTKINFLAPKFRKFASLGSLGLIVITFVVSIGVRGSDTLGIDFKGGDRLILSFDNANKPATGDVRTALTDAGIADTTVQYQSATTVGGKESLQLLTPFEQGSAAIESLNERFPKANFELSLQDAAGPSVGKDVLQLAVISAAIAMFAILFYVAIRFEFSFAIGAIIALVHDVVLTIGLFMLLGGKLNAPIVAALLTIFGFSINDTIVIFDRIREALKLGRPGSFRQIVNRAINETLARTIITSGTTLLATLCLFVFGGPVIRDFALTFLIGIIVGTYSSIYVASSSVLWITKGKKPAIYTGPVETEGMQESMA